MIYVTIINSRKAVRIKYTRTTVITVNVNSGHLFILKGDDMPDFLISEACEAAEVLKSQRKDGDFVPNGVLQARPFFFIGMCLTPSTPKVS